MNHRRKRKETKKVDEEENERGTKPVLDRGTMDLYLTIFAESACALRILIFVTES
ncbi:hypothetical protein BDZ89DRAFT_1058316 [Hymenopellis radicata]|nr:hypothetical protein BDZ89DRAFT_1058316 [Hymenopellis radicata]